MTPEPKALPVERISRWRKLLTSNSDRDRTHAIETTNRRKAHHLSDVDIGDTVVVCGWVVSIAFPPRTVKASTEAGGRAHVVINDGTGVVEFEASADDGMPLLGGLIEVTGILRRKFSPTSWGMDAVLVERVH